MKGISFIVFVTLIHVTYGAEFCEKSQNRNDKCGRNGKCTNPECRPPPQTTPTSTGPTTTGQNTAGNTSTKPTTTAATTITTTATTPITTPTTTPKTTTIPTPATCGTCPANQECLYECTGQSGSIKHGLSPIVLVIGVVTKLFIS